MIDIRLIIPKNKEVDTRMIHRMLCFGFDSVTGSDSVKFTTFIYIDGKIAGVMEQMQNCTHLSATPSVDVMKHYLSSEYTLYSDRAWSEMDDGNHKITDVSIDWDIDYDWF